MIARYAREEMTAIWSASTKFQIWFEIEAHACDAQANLGVIPKEAAAAEDAKGSTAEDSQNDSTAAVASGAVD